MLPEIKIVNLFDLNHDFQNNLILSKLIQSMTSNN